MKNYDPENKNVKHAVKIFLQSESYRGSFVVVTGGNSSGFNVIEWCIEGISDGEENFLDNEIGFKVSEDFDDELWFSCRLKDESGDTLILEEPIDGFKKYVVGVVIIGQIRG